MLSKIPNIITKTNSIPWSQHTNLIPEVEEKKKNTIK